MNSPMSGSGSGSGPQGAKGGNARLAIGFIFLVLAGIFGYRTFIAKKDGDSGKSESSSTTAGTGDVGALPQSGDVIQLTMWDQEEARNTVHLDKWIDDFQNQNPGIKITRQTFLNEELRTRYTTFATGGQAPEIVYGPNDNAGVFATAKLISPVDEFVDVSQFTSASLEVARLGGKYMAVPLSYGNHLILFYNKKMLPEPPKTTDELIATAKKFSDPAKNVYGFVFNQIEPFWVAPFLGGFGGWPLQYDESGAPKITLDNPPMVATLAFLKKLKFDDKVIPGECDYDCAKGIFLEGKAPLTINGDWVIPEFTTALGKEVLGIAPLPVVSATGKPMTPMVSGRYLFLSNAMSPERKAAVKKFVQYLTSIPVQIEVATLMNRIPAVKAALDSPDVQALSDLKPIIDAAANGRAMPADEEMRAAWDSMRPALQKVMAGTLEPKDAARLMQQSALEQLASMRQ
jgi:arabinogalactan oligomer / maltooligosaccharide transport system substrate-binding protein